MYISYVMYMVNITTCISMSPEDRLYCRSKGITVSKLLAQAIEAVKTEKLEYKYI